MAEKKPESFEKQLEKLQKITDALEDDELGLEKSLALYKDGMRMVRQCRESLEEARLKLRLYTESGLEDLSLEQAGEPAGDSGIQEFEGDNEF
ncbi:exodeoxyribonuclease VII small subunit [Desulfovibrio sp. OttesenSCG-928-C14]|nr:exodeoxyribonuclease VII small subunit [Desulfovibrio sp. OttesenSCG-928-C14]